MTTVYRDMATVRSENTAAGHHFFDPGTIRYFGSRIGRTLYGGRYFITSEQPPHGPRRYTVREVTYPGACIHTVHTVGYAGHFETSAEARAAIKNLLKG